MQHYSIGCQLSINFTSTPTIHLAHFQLNSDHPVTNQANLPAPGDVIRPNDEE